MFAVCCFVLSSVGACCCCYVVVVVCSVCGCESPIYKSYLYHNVDMLHLYKSFHVCSFKVHV